MKRANLGRGLLILATIAFFGYRYWQSGGVVYPTFIIIFAGSGLLSLIDRLPARWQNITLNLGLMLIFLDLAFVKINLAEVGREFAAANYWMLVPSTLLVFLHLYFRTLRWQWLLKPMGDVSFWPAFRGLVIGITGNLLPARAGEFLRAYVLGRSTGLSKTGVFATLVVERIFDGLTALLVLLIVMVLGVRDERLQQAGLAGAVFFVGAMVGVIVFMVKRHWADTLVHKFLPENFGKLISRLLDGFSSGLAILKNPRQLAMVMLWNILTWIMIPLALWFALLVFDFGAALPWQAPVLMFPAMALGLIIPLPGGVGPVQGAVILTLNITFAGLAKAANFDEVVGAASILIHLSQFVPEIIPGIFSFMIEGLSTQDISTGRSMTGGEAVS